MQNFGQRWAFFFSTFDDEYLQMTQLRDVLHSLLSVQYVIHSGGFITFNQVVVDHVLYLMIQS